MAAISIYCFVHSFAFPSLEPLVPEKVIFLSLPHCYLQAICYTVPCKASETQVLNWTGKRPAELASMPWNRLIGLPAFRGYIAMVVV